MDRLPAGARALGLELSARQVEQFERYYAELIAWNEKVNLTAITDRSEVEAKHFLDSLSTLLVPLPPNASAIDVGTGAGLPGIPLKIVRPDLELTLLESVGKKTRFLHHVVAVLGLTRVEVLLGRAEEFGHNAAHREHFDVALSRAVAALAVLAELTLPFVRVGGRAILHKQGDLAAEITASARALDLLGGELESVVPVHLPGLPPGRKLVVIRKVRPTPAEYPRRAGIPNKRPL